MENNVKLMRIGDLVDVRRGASPRPIEEWLTESNGFPWVKISDATSTKGRYINSTNQFIKYDGISSSVVVHPEDLIISNSGSPALPFLMGIDACVHDGWLIISNYRGITRDYLYYAIKNYRNDLLNQGNGSIFKNLRVDLLENFKIPIKLDTNGEVDISYQDKAISSLKKIDLAIENNIRILNKLKDLLSTIYSYWFLQFDFPNKDNKPYKLNNGKMIWNDDLNREIPSGWEVVTIRDLIFENNKSKVQVGEASDKGKYLFYTSGENVLRLDEYMVDNVNIFLSTGGNATVKIFDGKISYSTDTYCVEFGEYTYYIYQFLLKILPCMDQLYFAGTGLKHLQKDIFKNTKILIPTKELIYKFNNIAKPIIKQVSALILENEELESLRDFLLPLLMNGQVTIKDGD